MTQEIVLVLSVLGATVLAFVTNRLRVDVVAILIMVLLPWLGLIEPREAFSGLASNAVLAVIAIMILGHGVDRSGALNRLIHPILRAGGREEKRLILFISLTAGVFSAFIQNVGAAALFLPLVIRIARNTGIPSSRLLIPMGFSVILGGNITMVGSSALLVLNDLLDHGGQPVFGLFAAAPVGVALLLVGALYFFQSGPVLLPAKPKPETPVMRFQRHLVETWKLPTTIYQCVIPAKSPLVGKTRQDAEIWTKYRLNLLAIAESDDVLYAPWRHTPFVAGQRLALLGERGDLLRFVSENALLFREEMRPFEDLQAGGPSGFAELVVPVRSPMIGKTLQEIGIRKNYGVEPIMLLSGDREERGDFFSDAVLQAGSTLIVHGLWERMHAAADNIRFVLATPIEQAPTRETIKPAAAVFCFAAAVALTLAGVPISLGFFTGAAAMVLIGVVQMDEAYRAIDWRTVFLLAGLIPLGLAMKKTGAAEYLAVHILSALQGCPLIFVLLTLAALTTLFSLFMSNIAATVVMVPIAMRMGELLDVSPRALALLVALCASNSFFLPTHQVNALILSPGGYKNTDFCRIGGPLTLVYLLVTVLVIRVFYLS
ncbi:MAG TPA: SLC13 family permease [Syntrophales bacterium]|nr:SLC13 family permease [Syntrophales bacterium]